MTKRKQVSLRFLSVLIPVFLPLLLKVKDFLDQGENGLPALLIAAGTGLLTLLLILLKPGLKKRKYGWYLFVIFLLIPLFLLTGIECLNGNMLWQIEYSLNVLMNYLLVLMVEISLYAIFGSVRISTGITAVLMTVFGIVNMYCKAYKGSPLLPWDITSITTAANVADSFRFEITYDVIFMYCMMFCSLALIMPCKMPEKKSRLKKMLRFSSAVLSGIFIVLFWGTDFVTRELQCAPDFFNQTRGYENNGAWAEFLLNTKYLTLSRPDGYDPEILCTEIAENTNTSSTILKTEGIDDTCLKDAPEQPSVIVIMNESFSDLSVIGDFETNIPYMPYIDSLKGQENVIEGNVYVSTIGTGTSNTEYEFLTGNPMAFLPAGSNAYQLYVSDSQPGYTSFLKAQGYSADAMHPYYSSSWNRVAVYNAMQFDTFTSINQMKEPEKIRRFVSDDYDFRLIEQMYEERDSSVPFFLFNITMQNHSSYETVYSNFEQRVNLEGLSKEYPYTDQYLSLIRETDDSFRELIEYFSSEEEPVIILMFGDHQPFIENGFYEEVMGSPLSSLSDEEAQKRYITRFVMWANYDIPEGWIDAISVNYLSALLNEIAGSETTDYLQFIETAYEQVPVVTQLGCIDHDGNYFRNQDKNDYEAILGLYEKAAYNSLIDTENRQDSLFESHTMK